MILSQVNKYKVVNDVKCINKVLLFACILDLLCFECNFLSILILEHKYNLQFVFIFFKIFEIDIKILVHQCSHCTYLVDL